MQYHYLGNTGLKVSELALGTQTFGWGVDKSDAFDLADGYSEAGGNFFDTANIYNQGVAESTLGSWLLERGQRDSRVVATKVFFPTGEGPNDTGLSRQHISTSTEQSLRRSQGETIHRLAIAAEFRDNDTARHTMRMSRFCELLARRLGLDNERCELIRSASPLHDIGKIGISDTILLKPGKHTDEERKMMQRHADFGHQMLRGSDSELLQFGAIIAWTHHEKFDGSGYPRGLKGEDIPLEGRITAVADVFDALTSTRPYKRPYSVERSLEMMSAESGTHFEPALLELFKQNLREVHLIREQFSNP